MKHYQLTYLISSDLTEDEAKNVQENLNSLVQDKKGILVSSGAPLVKKRLGYAIQKKINAYLGSLSFCLEKENLPELQQEIKNKKEILRSMLFFQKPAKKESLKIRRVRKEEPKTEEEKIEIAEIDKKLDEILDK
ncbi:MAG: 30S ribosomal protein S6 [bacterium]